jgi:copper(I)-binding protein
MHDSLRASRPLVPAIATLLLAALIPATASGQGGIGVENPWARATAPGQMVSGGYMTLINPADRPDRLLGASSAVAGEVQIHQTSMDGGVMRMRQLADGMELPAKGRVEFRPGAAHLMFMQLRTPLEAGSSFPVQLRFRDAGTVEVTFRVQGVNAGPAATPSVKPQ